MYSDLFEYNFITAAWKRVTVVGHVPRARYRATMTAIGSKKMNNEYMVLYGMRFFIFVFHLSEFICSIFKVDTMGHLLYMIWMFSYFHLKSGSLSCSLTNCILSPIVF